MTEELKSCNPGFKIWRNPSTVDEPVTYLGEYFPPDGSFYFTDKDLRGLGFGPGKYTVLAPEGHYSTKLFSKWQKVTVPE